MSTLRSLILATVVVFCASPALPCTPCITKSPLERTVAQASVIAHVVNNDQNCAASLDSGPAVVKLTVKTVYKGSVDEGTVDVHSWYGQCVFGVHLGVGEEAVVLLQEATDIYTGEWDGTYKLVEDGCSEGQLDVLRDRVRVKGRLIPLAAFASQYVH